LLEAFLGARIGGAGSYFFSIGLAGEWHMLGAAGSD